MQKPFIVLYLCFYSNPTLYQFVCQLRAGISQSKSPVLFTPCLFQRTALSSGFYAGISTVQSHL